MGKTLIKMRRERLRDGSMVKITDCACKGPETHRKTIPQNRNRKRVDSFGRAEKYLGGESTGCTGAKTTTQIPRIHGKLGRWNSERPRNPR
jgi:hypothetical protein